MTDTQKDPNKIFRDYIGDVIINNVRLQVTNFATFSGTPHWGVIGKLEDGKNVIGWIPCALCEMPE